MSDKSTNGPGEISEPQRLVLLNLLNGRFPDHHLRGMSQFGGHQKVMAALYRKKMVESYRDQDGSQADRLTDLGRQIAKYWAGRATAKEE